MLIKESSLLDKTFYGEPTVELIPGVYLTGLNPGLDRRSYESYPALGEIVKVSDGYSYGSFSEYGVCDDYRQILEQCPDILSSDRQFVITLAEMCKSDQPDWGGWRWHKWGPYIGVHEPQCEYLYDEPEIEQVYCYHIYEKKAA